MKGAKAPSSWAPGGSEKSVGSVGPLPWEWPHHPHPWSGQGLAVGCCSHAWDCCAAPCSLIFFFSSLPLPRDGGGSHPWDEVEPLQQQRESSDRHTAWVFFSTHAVGSSQSQTILLCFANILPSETASNLQLCCSNAYIKPKAKSFRIWNPHFVGSWLNYMRKNGRIPIPHSMC